MPNSESCRSRAPLALVGELTTSPSCELPSLARLRLLGTLLLGALIEYWSHAEPDLDSLLLSLSLSLASPGDAAPAWCAAPGLAAPLPRAGHMWEGAGGRGGAPGGGPLRAYLPTAWAGASHLA